MNHMNHMISGPLAKRPKPIPSSYLAEPKEAQPSSEDPLQTLPLCGFPFGALPMTGGRRNFSGFAGGIYVSTIETRLGVTVFRRKPLFRGRKPT